MSKYTTELRFICEMKSGFTTEELQDKSPEEVITAASPEIFNFDFPIYDEALRIPLELKILRHYYTREIGQETFGLWQWRLQSRLIEIMPKYNKLYEMEYKAAAASGLNNIDVMITRNSETNSRNTTHDTTSSESKDAYSDTPQGGLSDVEDLDYLTDYRNIKNSGTADGIADGNAQGMENSREYGYRGSKTFFELMKDFNDAIINIDQLIILELNDLFFLLY